MSPASPRACEPLAGRGFSTVISLMPDTLGMSHVFRNDAGQHALMGLLIHMALAACSLLALLGMDSVCSAGWLLWGQAPPSFTSAWICRLYMETHLAGRRCSVISLSVIQS